MSSMSIFFRYTSRTQLSFSYTERSTTAYGLLPMHTAPTHFSLSSSFIWFVPRSVQQLEKQTGRQDRHPVLTAATVHDYGNLSRAIAFCLVHPVVKVPGFRSFDLEMKILVQFLADHVRAVGAARELLASARGVAVEAEQLCSLALACGAFLARVDCHERYLTIEERAKQAQPRSSKIRAFTSCTSVPPRFPPQLESSSPPP